MALDGAFLYTIRRELLPLIGAKADKIYQPAREELIIILRGRSGGGKLLISAAAGSARVALAEDTAENPMTPPMFCMLMRKHLIGAVLTDIRMDGLERILFFDFAGRNEMGDEVLLTLVAEIMGRYSNIILTEGGRVIDCIKRVNTEMSRERPMLPGIGYTPPQKPGRLCPITAEREDILLAINAEKDRRDAELSKTVMSALEGFSPILARECVFRAAGSADIRSGEASDEVISRLCDVIMTLKRDMLGGGCRFFAMKNENGVYKDFTILPITQYGGALETREFNSGSELLSRFFYERDSAAGVRQRSADLFKFLTSAMDRTSRKLAARRQELSECRDRDKLRINGELIGANIYRLEKGMNRAVVENYFEEGMPTVEIPMDIRLTPAENSQRYFAEYRKAETAERMLTGLISDGEKELSYLDSVLDSLTRATTEAEITALREELSEQGYLRRHSKKKGNAKRLPPLKFVSEDGFEILVGRNPRQNEELSLKIAEPRDIWLHTHNIPGSHVIIRAAGREIPDSTIEQAALIAAYHSKAGSSSQVPVDYTFAMYVKKPSGAKPGMVIFTNNKTAFVTPDRDRIFGSKKQEGARD